MHPLVKLAKLAVEIYLKENKVISHSLDIPEEFLSMRKGVFVTIMKEGSLRGCMGTFLPTRENVAQETIFNAIAAATEDYRFLPIMPEEVPGLSFSVSVLEAPQPVDDIKKLDPKKFGIIVKCKNKTGLLLPDIEGVDTLEDQVGICCQKGGIDLSKEKVELYSFTVTKYQ